jgi:cytochrome c-type biogenesis protein CcmH
MMNELPFWWLAAGIIAFCLLMIAPALRSERAGRLTLLLLTVLMPLGALGLYKVTGTPGMIQPTVQAQGGQPSGDQGNVGPAEIRAMVEGLARKMEDDPDNIEGWYMLGRSWFQLGEYDKAVAALRQLVQRDPENPSAHLALAEAISATQNGMLKGEPTDLAIRATELDADFAPAWMLRGMAEEQAGNFEAAISLMREAESLLQKETDPSAGETLSYLQAHIEQLEQAQPSVQQQ